ncbi:MAG: chromate efflux transporter [Rhodospirillaceae bacterium]
MRNTVPYSPRLANVSFAEAIRVWARIGILSFGGPAGQIALMHRELVEQRRWISDGRFLHALNYCMLLPGPEAQQLATYIGWLMHRTAGGLVAGLLFVLPGFVTILALSAVYVAFGNVPWLGAVFFGLKAAVLAIVIEALVRIGKRALRNGVMIALAGAAFVAIYFLKAPFPLIVAAAAAFGLIAQRFAPNLIPAPLLRRGEAGEGYLVDRLISESRLPHIAPDTGRTIVTGLLWLSIWVLPIALTSIAFGPGHFFTRLGVFFSKAAIVTFGGAYSVLAYVAQQVVEVYGWVTAGEMLDGLALAETTPGPLIMVVQFVGYLASTRFEGALGPLAAGVTGSIITTWVTFAPCFLWIFVGAPYIETLIGNRWLNAALSSITAAVVGVILNLSVWFAVHTLFRNVREVDDGLFRFSAPEFLSIDPVSLLIALGSALALLRFHVGVTKVLAAAAAVGLVWRFLLA